MIMYSIPIIDIIGRTLICSLWQIAVIGLFCVALQAFLQKPTARYLVHCIGLCSSLIIPFVCGIIQANRAVVQSGNMNAIEGGMLSAGANNAGDIFAFFQKLLHEHVSAIVMVWTIGICLLAIRRCAGLLWIDSIRSPSMSYVDVPWQRRLDDLLRHAKISYAIEMRVCPSISSPITIGIFRPLILLPTSLVSGMPVELVEALLMHELAHVKRCDYAVNLCQSVIEMLLFYHPVVWMMSRQIRIAREEIADDLASKNLAEPRRLALALAELDQIQFSHNHFAQAAHGGNLMSRIQRLVRPELKKHEWKSALAMLLLALTFLGLNSGVSAMSDSDSAKQLAGVSASGNKWTQSKVDFLKCTPEYPQSSLQNQEAGTVMLSVLIGADGSAKKGKIDRSSGYPALDNAVIDKLLSCGKMATPATKNGKAIASWTKVQYVWKLE